MNKDDKTFKAFIFTDAGNHVGYGHLTRCMVLYEELKSRNIETQIYINADEDILFQANVQYFNWDNVNFEAIVNKNDICIIDSYQVTPIIEKRLSKITNKLLFIDDLGRYDRPGFVLNYSLNPKPPIKDYPKLLLGPEYALIREPFASYQSEFVIKENVEKVLISLGRSTSSKFAFEILNTLAPLHQNVLFQIIVGNHDFPINHINAQITDFLTPEELLNSAINSDLIFVSPSQTLFEFLLLKVPIITVKTSNNQSMNVYDEKSNVSVINPNKSTFNKLVTTFEHFLNIETRKISLPTNLNLRNSVSIVVDRVINN